MDNLANLTYSVNTAPLERVRTQLRGIAADAQTATSQLGGVGSGGAIESLGRSSRTATSQLGRTSQQATRTGRALNRLGSDATATSRSFNSANRETGLFVGGLGRLRNLLGGLAIAQTARSFLGLADTYRGLNAQLRIVTDTAEEFNFAQENIALIANRSRSSIEGISRLYTRIAPNLRETGESQESILNTVELTNRAIALSGGTASENLSTVTQFAQALGSGVLQGDELRSILENSTGFALQLAAGLGVPLGRLRELGSEGVLTTEVIIQALNNQETEINQLFNELPVTSGQAWTLVQNQTLQTIGRIDEALNISTRWTELLVGVARAVGVVGDRLLAVIDDTRLRFISLFTVFNEDGSSLSLIHI